MKPCLLRLPLITLLLLLSMLAVAQDDQESPLPLLRPRVQAWNAALNKADMTALGPLYADQVQAYGTTMSRAACMEGKRAWLAKNPGFKQELDGIFWVCTTPEGIQLSFTKTSGLPGKTKTVEAYLVFDRETLLILRESDLVTDANLAKKLKAQALPQGQHCFIATGDMFPEIAMPVTYELNYRLHIADGKVSGDGSYYSWAMRTMNELKISGSVLPDNSLSLTVQSFGPLYFDDEKDVTTWKEIRKYDGNRLIWAGGDESGYPEMESTDCE